MDQPSTDDRIRRRRRSTKPPLKIVSDLPDNVPVTQAEIDLFISFMGDRIEQILRSARVAQAGAGQPTEPTD